MNHFGSWRNLTYVYTKIIMGTATVPIAGLFAGTPGILRGSPPFLPPWACREYPLQDRSRVVRVRLSGLAIVTGWHPCQMVTMAQRIHPRFPVMFSKSIAADSLSCLIFFNPSCDYSLGNQKRRAQSRPTPSISPFLSSLPNLFLT